MNAKCLIIVTNNLATTDIESKGEISLRVLLSELILAEQTIICRMKEIAEKNRVEVEK